MGSVNVEVLDADQYKSILDKTSKLSEKIQKQKRTAPRPQPKQVKRIKIEEGSDVRKEFKPKISKQRQANMVNTDRKNDINQKVKKERLDEMSEGTPIKQEGGEKTNWKEFKLEKKLLKIKRQTNKNTVTLQSIIGTAKQLWIQLTLKTQSKAKQHEYARQLLTTIKGHVLKCAWKHDTSRFLQALISKGPPEVVDQVFEHLKDNILELSKGKYSHWCIVQLLKHGTRAHRQHIISTFDGSVLKLMNSSVGCRVLEDAFNDHATAKERARILQEFYSVDFRHVKDDNLRTLKDVLEQNPNKKIENLTRVNSLLKKLIGKGRWRLYLFHNILYDYLMVAEEDEKKELLESAQEHLVEMVHTKEGARVAMISLWDGDKKTRKQIIKSFKGKVLDVCKEAQGHRVLLAMFDCVDDTVVVSKVILQEILANFDDVMASDSGRKVVLYVFGHREKRFFDPDTIEFLSQGDGNPNTKKSIENIHSELMATLVPGLTDHLANNVAHYFKDNSLVFFFETVVNYVPVRAKIFHSIASYVVTQDWNAISSVRSAWKCIARLCWSVQTGSNDQDESLCLVLLEKLSSSTVSQIATNFEGKSLLCSLILSHAEHFPNQDHPEVLTEIIKFVKKAVLSEGAEMMKKWISAVGRNKDALEDDAKRLSKLMKSKK